MKTVIALLVAAGLAGTAFAQTAAPAATTPAATPAAKMVSTPAMEKKVEAPKAGEPGKAEVAKSAHPMTPETAKTEAKVDEHLATAPKQDKKVVKTHAKPVAKTEASAPASK